VSDRRTRLPRAQRLPIVTAVLAFVVLLCVLQLWLFTATVHAYLGGDTSILVPAALGSAVCLALVGGLVWYVYRLDR
jgi:hypothetical protein